VSPARPAEEPGLVRGRVPPVPPPPTLARPRGQAPARAPAGPPESQRQVVDKVHQAAQDQARRQARAGEAAQARQAPVAGPERRAPQGARLGPLGQRDRAARRLFARAQADLEGRRYAEALNGFEQFLLQYPDHELAGEATFRAADAFFSLHEREMPLYYAQAMEKYQRGVDLYPESDQVPWALLQMGRVAMLAGEPFKAKGYFQIVQEDYPDSEYAPLAMVNIGRAYLADQDFGLALDTFREVAEKYPESRYRKEADWGQAQALFGMARYERASLLLQDMDRRFPRLRLEDPELLYYIGEAEFQLKRYQKARRYFLWALNVMPEIRDNDIILTRVGDTYQFEKAYEAARDIYRRVVKDFPGSDGALVARIRLAESPAKDTDHPWDIFQVQATTDALKTYQEILDNHPQRPVAELAQLKMGVYYYKKKKYAKSLAILEELLQKNPRTPFRPEVTYTLDLTTVAYLQELKRQGKPLALMDAYLRNRASLRRPNSNQMLETLAWAYQRTGLNQRAAKLYRVLISRGLNRPQYHMGLAENLMAEGDYQGVAEALPQKVIAKLADQAAVKGRSLLGRALARLGRCGEAEPLLRYVLEQRFDYPWIAQDYFALGRCLVGMDRVEEGLEALEQAAARFGPDRQLERYLVAMTAGSAARGAGKPRRALGLFERAESLALSDRDRAQAIYEQGQTLRRLDERARVAETFRRLAELKVSPWSDMAARHLADMELAPRLAEVGTGPLDGQ
jgi:TolA-binding protein